MEDFDLRWYSVLNLAAGVWLLFTHILSITDVPVMSGWAAYGLGAYIATISGVTLQTHDRRFHAVNGALGLATIVSPFLFGFAGHSAILLHFVAVGGIVTGTSAWAALTGPASESDREATAGA